MLFYDRNRDELVPLIPEDLNGEQKKFAELFAGNFPINSFSQSLSLLQYLDSINVESKLVLIVNDHKFQSRNFQQNIATLINGRTNELRKAYYGKNTIPVSYSILLRNHNLSENVIQQYFVQNKQKQEAVKKHGFFFSEQRLRNKFEKHLREKLLNEGKVRKVDIHGSIEIHYEGFLNSDICLTENGSCGCSGEIMEFIYELSALGYNEVYFFIPAECREAANNGCAVVTHILETPMTITTIHGAEGIIRENINFHITRFSNDRW